MALIKSGPQKLREAGHVEVVVCGFNDIHLLFIVAKCSQNYYKPFGLFFV